MKLPAARMDDSAQPRVNRFERIDRGALKPPVRMDNGFLKVEGRIARTGTQIYRDAQGKDFIELRLPEEVFAKDSLESFHLVPVTNTHPPGLLTSGNAKLYSVGALGQDAHRDEDFVASSLMLTDADAIISAEAGRCQLSNGYSCELDYTQDPKLVEQYGRYDAIQRKIRGNHCALVDFARAGPEARLRLDDAARAANFGQHDEVPVASSSNLTNPTENRTMPIKTKLDGMEIEVDSSNSVAIIERAIEKARADGEAKAKSEKDRADKAELELVAAKKSLAEVKDCADKAKVQAELDAAKMEKCDTCGGSGEVKGKDGEKKDCKDCDGKGKFKADSWLDAEVRNARIDRLAAQRGMERASILAVGGEHLSKNIEMDAMSNNQIKRLVVEKLRPGFIKADDEDAKADMAFELLVKEAKAAQPTASQQLKLVRGDGNPKRDGSGGASPAGGPDAGEAAMAGNMDAGEQARIAMIERSRKANRGEK